MEGFANETYHLFIADCTVSVADFLGDLILIYRCWIIWGGNYYITILPLLTSAAGLSEYLTAYAIRLIANVHSHPMQSVLRI